MTGPRWSVVMFSCARFGARRERTAGRCRASWWCQDGAVLSRIDNIARQTLADHAAFARAALVRLY